MENLVLIKDHLAIAHSFASKNGDTLLSYLIEMAILETSDANVEDAIDGTPTPMSPKPAFETLLNG
jgi:hypothetical protein